MFYGAGSFFLSFFSVLFIHIFNGFKIVIMNQSVYCVLNHWMTERLYDCVAMVICGDNINLSMPFRTIYMLASYYASCGFNFCG